MRKNYLIVAILSVLAFGAMNLDSEPSITVSLIPGPDFSHKVKFGLVSMNLTPQMAVWIESADGAYIDTIFVTGKSAAAAWSAAGGARRPEALPVWSHARGVAASDGIYMPDKKHPVSDAVSGATPSKAVSYTWKIPASRKGTACKVRVELNSSYDWNEAYPDKLPKTDPRWSEVNGQPSVIYEAAIELGGGASSAALKPVGTGSLRGEDGKVNPSLEGLTTALRLVETIMAELKP
jgi:hypothetical protein